MDRKSYTIILAITLLVSFFLPYLNYGAIGRPSAFRIVMIQSKNYQTWDLVIKYIWLLVPLSAVMLLIGSLRKNDIPGRLIWTWIPLLTLLFLVGWFYLNARNIGGRFVSSAELFSMFAFGFWLAFTASVLLAFYTPKTL